MRHADHSRPREGVEHRSILSARGDRLQPAALPAFTVEITSAVGQPSNTVIVTAPDGTGKTAGRHWLDAVCTVYLEGFTPASAKIRLTWDSDTAEFEVRPTYDTTYSNSRDCTPACSSTRVVLTLPPS